MSEKRSNESGAVDELLREELSAFMDGELDADRARFLQQRLRHDTELRARWERWQLQSSAMRRQAQPLPADFADRVASVLDAEAVNAVPARSRALRWAGGAALAASFAVAGVFVFDATHQPPTGGPRFASTPPATQPAVATAVAAKPVSPPATVAVASVQRSAPANPEAATESPRIETARIVRSVPARNSVAVAFRSPPRSALARHRRSAPEFSPFAQSFAIDPDLSAYLERQKSGNFSDPYLRRPPTPPFAQDDSVRTVSYPQSGGH
jgi:negative regulator of sigma E activity